MLLHLLDHAVLQLEVLKHRLNDQVRLPEVLPPVGHVVGQGHQAGHGHVFVEARHGPARHLALQVGLYLPLPALQRGQPHVLEQGAVSPRRHADLGDARAHEPRAQHRDGAHGPGVWEGVLAQRRLAEENGGEPLALRRDGEVGEGVGLLLVAALGGQRLCRHRGLDEVQDAQRRRVQAPAALHHLRAHLREDVVAHEVVLPDAPLDVGAEALGWGSLDGQRAGPDVLRVLEGTRLELDRRADSVDEAY
mmetsp:Transcript_67338/g.179731  ORF Transcript_67338/g.179731 Transcript_67338/m.179731 type:complete len:249 (-) Transcript_67338:728-1474(-)